MRSTLTLLAMMAAAPLTAQLQASGGDGSFLGTHEPQPASIRLGQTHSAAFLTESRMMAFGRVLGPLTPSAVPTQESPEMAMPGTRIGVRPPAGVTYQRGDTIILAVVTEAMKGWGSMIVPTGLARVDGSNSRQAEAVIIAVYSPVRSGQVTLPAAASTASTSARPTAVNGPTGSYLFAREQGDVHQMGSELFIDLGRGAGIKVGDVIDFRRKAEPRPNHADTRDEHLASGQVVSVGEKSSTVRLFHIADPVIPWGSTVVRVASLPN